MTLPGAWRAAVDPTKITGYLLDRSHPDNGGKAAFFASVGFLRSQWRVLADALRAHAAEGDVVAVVASRHGEKYVVDGRLQTPSGRRPLVRAVWIVDRGRLAPRLVTAYPAKETSR